MAIRWFSVPKDSRFYVECVTGWPINPASTLGGTGRLPTSAWSVFDSAMMHSEIATFVPGGGHTTNNCKAAAERLCAELNAEEVGA